jgi:hypothetical protein
VGLWDFRDGAPTPDSGLADGIAQNGRLDGDAGDAGGPFLLAEGTLAVRFARHAHVGTSNDTVVSHGDFVGAGDERYFAVELASSGCVRVIHRMPGGPEAMLSTGPGFFSPRDTVTVVYSWNAASGAALTVDNETTGGTETIGTGVQGLDFAIGDDPNLTFGARDRDDGHHSRFFEGSIDYVAVLDRDVTSRGFVVEGSSGADPVDIAHTGDRVGDTIDAGDDTAGTDADPGDAGAGDVAVQGREGNDTLFGDAHLGAAGMRESFERDPGPDPDSGIALDSGDAITLFTQDTGTVGATFPVPEPDPVAENECEEIDQVTAGLVTGGAAADPDSDFHSDAHDKGNTETHRLAVSAPVGNVRFRVDDIDGDVRVGAFDAHGAPMPCDDTLNGGTGGDDIKARAGDNVAIGARVKGGKDPDDDIDVLDLRGFGPLEIIYDDAIDPGGEPGESGKVIFYKDAAKTEQVGELIFKEIENVIPCFTPGTMIATPRGEVPAEALREGDRVLTRDNGFQEIRWIASRTLSRDALQRAPGLRPVLIRSGSLGAGLPERDMLVSPKHRVLIHGEAPQLHFAESEVLVAAEHLAGRPGIEAIGTLRTTYVHFMFDRHEVVLSDGAWTESFQPGAMTLRAMGEEQRAELLAVFPGLETTAGLDDYGAARRALKAHEARLLQL